MEAEFSGPIVECKQPIVDFGLVKVNSQEDMEVEIENKSPIPAEILIKNSLNSRLSFENMISIEQIKSHDTSTASLLFDKPFLTPKGNQLLFEQYRLTLQPNQTLSVLLSLKTSSPETIEEYFEIMVQNGASRYLQVHSSVQRPHVALNRILMNLGRIYAGVPEYVNPQSKHAKQSLVLKNYGNLPAHFRWEQKNDTTSCVAKFEPSSGVIQPKSELKVKMTVTVFTGGNLNELFLCEVQDMELPTGFEMLADAYGLNVSYETQEEP